MRYLYTLLLVLSVALCSAQTSMPFVNSSWSEGDFGVISEQLGGILGGDYCLVNEPVSTQTGTATLHFKTADGSKLVTVELSKGTLSGNGEVVKQVQISGPFADVYSIYQKLFNALQTPEEIKQKGSIRTEPVLVSGKKYTASLRREGNRSSDQWMIVIKD